MPYILKAGKTEFMIAEFGKLLRNSISFKRGADGSSAPHSLKSGPRPPWAERGSDITHQVCEYVMLVRMICSRDGEIRTPDL